MNLSFVVWKEYAHLREDWSVVLDTILPLTILFSGLFLKILSIKVAELPYTLVSLSTTGNIEKPNGIIPSKVCVLLQVSYFNRSMLMSSMR